LVGAGNAEPVWARASLVFVGPVSELVSKPKVAQDCVTVVRQKDIGKLDIPMDDAESVDGVERHHLTIVDQSM
jgi:hypothetical protein